MRSGLRCGRGVLGAAGEEITKGAQAVNMQLREDMRHPGFGVNGDSAELPKAAIKIS